MNDLDGLVVVGTGKAEAPQPGMFEARIRSTVRYADSSAWTTATAVAIAVQDLCSSLTEFCHETGMVVVSDDGPRATMAEVEAQGATGFSSPLRYAASSPGTLVGVSCIAFGFRGPTLNLTMAPEDGLPLALAMCSAWLSRNVVRFMVLATFRAGASSPPSGRAVVLAPAGLGLSGSPLTTARMDWLAGCLPTEHVRS